MYKDQSVWLIDNSIELALGYSRSTDYRNKSTITAVIGTLIVTVITILLHVLFAITL